MFLQKIFLVFSVVIAVNVNSSFGRKPAGEYLTLCHRGDPDLDACLQKGMTASQDVLMKGVEDIGLPPMDPLFLKNLDMKEGSANFFTLAVANATLSGLRDMTIQNVKVNLTDPRDLSMKFLVKTKQLRLEGAYTVNGRILVIPVDGNGHLDLNFTQPVMKISMKGYVFPSPKDGSRYIGVKSFNVDMTTKGGRAHLTNLFGGDKVLGRTVNNFFNENFQDLFGALKHLPQSFLAKAFKQHADSIFKAWPVEELLLP